ncbi:MAG: U32 family peptidase [Coriobacteriia bacterium]
MTLSNAPTHHVELLAPAGSLDALVAAVNNGADAVYLGLRELNARRGAENFDLDGLASACRFAHLRGARIYLTANVLIMPEEMSDALGMVDAAWAAGIDAVIVQDLGLLRVLRQALPHVRVHASTQLNTHDPATVAVLAGLGVSRITLARETSLDEIATIARESSVEIESFVHGALCFCFSGQCLMSSVIGGRSANRGMCAQPCRLAYELVSEDGAVTTPGRHLLSPRDLAGIAHLPALVDAGVAALKIEGRMKAPEYVAVVTRVYRAALDRALADPEHFAVTAAEWDLLEEAFSRGFTDAYLLGAADNEMMSHSRPNNRGVPVGRVVGTSIGRVEIALERALNADDTIEFWTGRGRSAQRVGPLEVDGVTHASAPVGVVAGIAVDSGVGKGDRVFRVANADVLEAARRTFVGAAAHGARPTPVDVRVHLKVGEPLVVRVTAGGFEAQAAGPVVEAARTKAVTADEVVEHVGRLGGSGYAVESWDIDLDHSAGIGYSALHAVRREALEALDEVRLGEWRGRVAEHPATPSPGRKAPRGDLAELVVSVPDTDLAHIALAAGASRVLVRVSAADECGDMPAGAAPLLPRVAPADEAPALLKIAAATGTATAGTLGLLASAAAAGVRVEADWPLNAVNSWSAAALADLGASLVWSSPELSGRRLSAVVESSPVPIGTLVAGRQELMIAEHCVLQAAGECSHRCATCPRRARRWLLRDQKGYEFPMLTDAMGRSHIYNSVPLDLTRALDEVLATGVAAVRVEITVETEEETRRLVSGVATALGRVQAGGAPPADALTSVTTSGHFFRGVR